MSRGETGQHLPQCSTIRSAGNDRIASRRAAGTSTGVADASVDILRKLLNRLFELTARHVWPAPNFRMGVAQPDRQRCRSRNRHKYQTLCFDVFSRSKNQLAVGSEGL